MKNYIVLSLGPRFFKKSLIDFVYAINVENKPSFLMPDGMLLVSAIFLVREKLKSKLML